MADLAQWIAIVVTLFNALITYLDKKVVAEFLKHEAISADFPIRPETFKPLLQWRVKRNTHAGIMRIGNTALYYFDREV